MRDLLALSKPDHVFRGNELDEGEPGSERDRRGESSLARLGRAVKEDADKRGPLGFADLLNEEVAVAEDGLGRERKARSESDQGDKL